MILASPPADAPTTGALKDLAAYLGVAQPNVAYLYWLDSRRAELGQNMARRFWATEGLATARKIETTEQKVEALEATLLYMLAGSHLRKLKRESKRVTKFHAGLLPRATGGRRPTLNLVSRLWPSLSPKTRTAFDRAGLAPETPSGSVAGEARPSCRSG
ncbi:MAG TPA: hypothetical protein VFF73_28060 [Planctomycetota bacterium]|nr:hypothetical protein [Planctomycetota bacterium]